MDYQPSNLTPKELKALYVGTSIDNLPTPSFIIDRNVFEGNCAAMMKKAHDWGASFRAHLKTHKTAEGTKRQCKTSAGKTGAVVVSTVKEAWEIWDAGLVKDRTIYDILYGLPVGANKIATLTRLWDCLEEFGGIVRILVDHPTQIDILEEFEQSRQTPRRWSVFIKLDGGQSRAGVPPSSEEFKFLLARVLASPAITLHGFYAHAGDAYASKSPTDATAYLSSEVQLVNEAAAFTLSKFSDALKKTPHTKPFVLSVGSTPTAHAAGPEARLLLQRSLHGKLELHAGNYPMLDLQQHSTGLIDYGRIAHCVRASVISYYPGRGKDGKDEALIDAGAIAFSKDTGPSGTYGEVIGRPWILSRMSQEHGILVCTKKDVPEAHIGVGDVVNIVGQHACLIAASHPWFYIVDSRVDYKTIVDVWVPWKGW